MVQARASDTELARRSGCAHKYVCVAHQEIRVLVCVVAYIHARTNICVRIHVPIHTPVCAFSHARKHTHARTLTPSNVHTYSPTPTAISGEQHRRGACMIRLLSISPHPPPLFGISTAPAPCARCAQGEAGMPPKAIAPQLLARTGQRRRVQCMWNPPAA